MTAKQSSSGTMRRVVVSTAGPHVVRADIPQPGPGEVLVRSVLAGVCGSDPHAAAGLHPWISLPYVPGHEVVGVVAKTGAGVSSVQPGRRVTAEPYLPWTPADDAGPGKAASGVLSSDDGRSRTGTSRRRDLRIRWPLRAPEVPPHCHE